MTKDLKIARSLDELSDAVLDRLENLKDFTLDYRRGKKGRIKSIASELRVLVCSGGSNNAILFTIAALNRIELIVDRDVPPIKGLKSSLSLKEYLQERVFLSNAPTPLFFTGEELIKKYSNQQGSHEDLRISEDVLRLRGQGLYIGGIPAPDAVILGIAETVLISAVPLMKKLRNG